ncbi:MAG: hypothetical protein M3O28_06035 [Actinomycetota bacterium]|nr:hypothetical protein [Actinomycetota bacterium]
MTSLPQRHASAKHAAREVAHTRPNGLSDVSISALGKLSEALEIVEHARGCLYEFHRLSGTADLTLQQAVSELREAGHGELADEIRECLVGRDVIDDKWTFQLIESYDRQYWQVFRDVECTARARLGDAPPHVFEAEMKRHEQQTHG